jgi:hypothetical protein
MSDDKKEDVVKIVSAIQAGAVAQAQMGFDAGWAAACEALEAVAATPGINAMSATEALAMCAKALEDVRLQMRARQEAGRVG